MMLNRMYSRQQGREDIMCRLDFIFLSVSVNTGQICLKKLNQVPQNWIPAADQRL